MRTRKERGAVLAIAALMTFALVDGTAAAHADTTAPSETAVTTESATSPADAVTTSPDVATSTTDQATTEPVPTTGTSSTAGTTEAVTTSSTSAATIAPPPTSASTSTTAPRLATTVTVNTRSGLARVPSTALGINDAVWDAQLGTTDVSDLLSAAGVQMIRYPGGSYSDIYHWKDNTAPGGYVAPNTDFDTYMASVKRVGAQPIIIANYGTGTPEEAADWVRYANVTKGYRAKYWEIGNELYGNGHYGSGWESDDHTDKSPTAYANGVVAYADAMKAVDPTVKIGAVLTTPANWPDGLVGSGDSGTWNKTVLSIAGPKIDFVILHWYPSNTSAADVLTKPSQINDAIYLVRQQITDYVGAGAARIGIALTETNTMIGMDTQPGALFAADTYTGMLENGVFTVDWWDLHNGPQTASTIAGFPDYGDMGALSSGTCVQDTEVCEPAINTPFPPFHAIQLLSRFARTGDQLVRAGTDQSLVSAHAARRANGDLAVLLVNKDPDHSYTAQIDYSGFLPGLGAPTVYSYTNGGTSVTRAATGTAGRQVLPPYSLTAIVVHPLVNVPGAPSAPGQPVASKVTDATATLSWPAAKPGRLPVARYEVYRQDGVTSTLVGQTKGTSLALTGLTAGTRYTYTVLAKDVIGLPSWSSLPVTLRTGAPATSTCAVHYADTNDWGNGFVGSIDITNNGTEAIDGWTLTFDWPAGQTLGSGWSGNWSQSGTTVSVTNNDFNGTLAAAGGSTNAGFVASYGAPNVPPVAFRLNGVLCSAS